MFEGEGCLRINETKYRDTVYRHARAELAITDEDVVRRFAAIVGVGSVGGPYQHRTERGQPAKQKWVWHLGDRREFARFGAMMEPWLGKRRRAKLAEILAATPTSHRGQRFSDEDIAAMRAATESNAAIARRFGASRAHVSRVRSGHSRKRLPA